MGERRGADTTESDVNAKSVMLAVNRLPGTLEQVKYFYFSVVFYSTFFKELVASYLTYCV